MSQQSSNSQLSLQDFFELPKSEYTKTIEVKQTGLGSVEINLKIVPVFDGTNIGANGSASLDIEKSFGIVSVGGGARFEGTCTASGSTLQCIFEGAVSSGATLDFPGDSLDQEFGTDLFNCKIGIEYDRSEGTAEVTDGGMNCEVLPDMQKLVDGLNEYYYEKGTSSEGPSNIDPNAENDPGFVNVTFPSNTPLTGGYTYTDATNGSSISVSQDGTSAVVTYKDGNGDTVTEYYGVDGEGNLSTGPMNEGEFMDYLVETGTGPNSGDAPHFAGPGAAEAPPSSDDPGSDGQTPPPSDSEGPATFTFIGPDGHRYTINLDATAQAATNASLNSVTDLIIENQNLSEEQTALLQTGTHTKESVSHTPAAARSLSLRAGISERVCFVGSLGNSQAIPRTSRLASTPGNLRRISQGYGKRTLDQNISEMTTEERKVA